MCAKEYLYTLPLHVVNPNPDLSTLTLPLITILILILTQGTVEQYMVLPSQMC